MRHDTLPAIVIAAALGFCLTLSSQHGAHAQFYGPPNKGMFRDASPLRPAPGQKVAVFVFQDMQCAACAHAAPVLWTASNHFHIPLSQHDFVIQTHSWARDAAINARYLQDKIDPAKADSYRRDVFASQPLIGSQEDLKAFTARWMQQHQIAVPFVIDPAGKLAAEVHADDALGERIGIIDLPTIVVATSTQYQVVTDVSQLYNVIDAAISSTKPMVQRPVGSVKPNTQPLKVPPVR